MSGRARLRFGVHQLYNLNSYVLFLRALFILFCCCCILFWARFQNLQFRKTLQICNNKWRQRLRMQRASVLGPSTTSIAPSKDRRNTMAPYHSLATLTSMNPSSVASSREESGGDWDGPLIVCCSPSQRRFCALWSC